jgi:hypothetical protein
MFLYRFIVDSHQVCVIDVFTMILSSVQFSSMFIKELMHGLCVTGKNCGPILHLVPHPTLHPAPHPVRDPTLHQAHNPTLRAQWSWRLVHWLPMMDE